MFNFSFTALHTYLMQNIIYNFAVFTLLSRETKKKKRKKKKKAQTCNA
jgi:hypothetical protein